MCVAALAAVASVAQAVVGFAGASAQADAQNQYYMENARAAQKAARDEYEGQNIKRGQVKLAADQNAFAQGIEALEARSKAFTAAGEAGVTGNSVDDFIGSLFGQAGRRYDALDSQYRADIQNIETEMRNTEARAQSRINSVRRADSPSPLPFIVNGISGAISAFNTPARGNV